MPLTNPKQYTARLAVTTTGSYMTCTSSNVMRVAGLRRSTTSSSLLQITLRLLCGQL